MSYVSFGEVARGRLGMQCQYAKDYLSAPLAEGIRRRGDLAMYHGITVHSDDVEEFVRRVLAHRKERGCG